MKTRTESRNGVYEIITDHIIKLLKKGTIPWKQTWSGKELPQNLLTRIPYRGINMMLLSACNFERNLFLTFNQIHRLSCSIEPGERSMPVVFWKWPEENGDKNAHAEDRGEEKKIRPILRYYSVFNISQCKNVPEHLIPSPEIRENYSINYCEQIIMNMPNRPEIQHLKQEAFYNPLNDIVNVPDIKFFEASEYYYSTLFHELIHSTGHTSRLNRQEGMENVTFGSENYSTEELIAEIGACFLKAQAGITDQGLDNNVAYINGWLKRLKKDKRVIVFASSQAQKAADYILSKSENEPEHVEHPTSVGEEVSKRSRKKGETKP